MKHHFFQPPLVPASQRMVMRKQLSSPCSGMQFSFASLNDATGGSVTKIDGMSPDMAGSGELAASVGTVVSRT